MKRILIIGGTNFIGRNLVEQLLKLGLFDITLFNRGLTNTHLFNNLKRIIGDRENLQDLKQLENGNWDIVIDVSCYYPKSLEHLLLILGNSISKYIFVSTCSVYNNEQHKGILRDETAPLKHCSIEEKTDRSTDSYGNRKAECERILQSANYPTLILRPALVFGKYDSTDRFYYWIYQAKHRNKTLLPENGLRKLSITYVMDLVQTIINALSNPKHTGTYNCISITQTSIYEIFTAIIKKFSRKVETVNAPVHFLNRHSIDQWVDIPLWLNSDDFTYTNQRIKTELGFKATPFNKSLTETINYFNDCDFPTPNVGIKEEKLEQLIQQL